MICVFGECELDVARRELRRAGVVRPLEPKAFTVLVHLLMQRHRAVSKDELLATCWPNELVTEAALTRCLKVIRQAVGDDGSRQHTIKTLRRHGYRFVAHVETRALLEAEPLHVSAPVDTPLYTPRSSTVAPSPAEDLAAFQALPSGLSCPHCQRRNRVLRQFCAACGQTLWRPCAQCGFGNSPTEGFCGGCGQDVTAPRPMAPEARAGAPLAYTPAPLASRILLSAPQVLSGERKPVTVLVARVDGLRALRQVVTPEEGDEALHRGFALLVAEIHQVEGFVSQVAGAGFTALFGAPLACEDHVLRALHAALGLQRAFARYAAELHQTYGVALTLQLGVHTGALVLRAISHDLQLAYTAPGAVFECATGLQQLSRGGSIVVSAAVQQQVVGYFQFAEWGMYTFPDLAAPVRVYTCHGVG